MASSTEGLTRHDLEAKIVKRCWEDEGFRREFTADPAGVFVKYLQVPAASLPKIAIHQETPGSWHIVLPAKPPHIDELTEEDLERVAGGTTPGLTFALSMVAVPISLGITISVGQDNGW
jgi:hypothetical protein